MILVQSPVFSSDDAGLSSVSDYWKQVLSHVWIPGYQIWLESIKCDKLLSSSQRSYKNNISEINMPNFVYKRRKIQRNSDAVLPLPQSSPPTIVYKRRKVQRNHVDLAPKSMSVDGASLGQKPNFEVDPKSKMQKLMNLYAIDEKFSSSKSYMDLRSDFLKPHVDGVGECSSSGALIMEGLGKMQICEKLMGVKRSICCLSSCKVSSQSQTTLKMQVCDLCEESFHVSCCNPPIEKVPVDEWFCHSCLRKNYKKLKGTQTGKSPKDNSGPIAFMLKDADTYKTNVRIGEDFQAEVPDWSGPITDDLNDYGEPVETSYLECASYQDWNLSKLSRLGSIGNWLQCREVIDKVNGTICGKWRRAPLLEVQTDNWDCFRSVLWDPAHADCAVPQELDTDQVLKHLKYIEMLRPRLAAKRCKLRANKGVIGQVKS